MPTRFVSPFFQVFRETRSVHAFLFFCCKERGRDVTLYDRNARLTRHIPLLMEYYQVVRVEKEKKVLFIDASVYANQ